MVEMPCCRCGSGVAAAAQGQAMALAMAMAMPASSGGMQQGLRHLKHHRPWAWTALAGLRLHPRSCSNAPSEVGAASKRRARGPIMAAKKAAEGRRGRERERESIVIIIIFLFKIRIRELDGGFPLVSLTNWLCKW